MSEEAGANSAKTAEIRVRFEAALRDAQPIGYTERLEAVFAALVEVADAAQMVMYLEYPRGGYVDHVATGMRGAEKWARLEEALQGLSFDA